MINNLLEALENKKEVTYSVDQNGTHIKNIRQSSLFGSTISESYHGETKEGTDINHIFTMLGGKQTKGDVTYSVNQNGTHIKNIRHSSLFGSTISESYHGETKEGTDINHIFTMLGGKQTKGDVTYSVNQNGTHIKNIRHSSLFGSTISESYRGETKEGTDLAHAFSILGKSEQYR